MTDSKTPKAEKPNFPNVSLPLKAKSSDKNTLQHYFSRLAGDPDSRFLFNRQGLWHQGIHLRADKFQASDYEHNICAIADGKVIAYKVDSEYKTDKTDSGSTEKAVYSTGFFLLEHELEYPKGNKLTFYSLYRHTAKLSDYEATMSKIIGETKSADKNPVMIRDSHNRPTGKDLSNGITILVRKEHTNKAKYDELVWYKDNQGKVHKPEVGEWRIYRDSYRIMQEEEIRGIPLLAKNNVKTQSDMEITLPNPLQVKAGEALGLMGEYNQAGESNQKLLHLEVFSYDDIEAFGRKAKAAYGQDKAAKRLTDNFLYIERGSQLYSIMNDEAYEFDTTSVEIMIPLSEVKKVTIGQGKNKKDYYDVAAYLNNIPEKSEAKIYVDDTHLTHGVLFPGVNVFSQASNSLCIFKAELHERCDPNTELSEVEKERLDPMFGAILEELDLDKDKPTKYKAGKLNLISLNPSRHRRMTGIIAKHDNEWKTTRVEDFTQMMELYRRYGREEMAGRLAKRVQDLAISLKVNKFDTEKQAYYIHPLAMVGWFIRGIKGLIDRDFFFSQYEKLFEKLTNAQKQALENIFTGIEEYIEAEPSYICTLPKIAYMLATAKHETGHTFEPITERGNRAYFNKYDPILADTSKRREAAIQMENTKKGDGYKYRGRGYVQLTWRKNYRKSGEYLHKDLVNNPELALDQKNATKIMIYGMEIGMFTGRKMSDYISGNKKDYLNARRIINGTDKAKTIAEYAHKLEECLRWL